MSQHTERSAPPQVVCITGMERSGTSLVARLVNLLGVYLGPTHHLIIEMDYNPKGCWEHEPLQRLNNDLLLALGGDTYAPPDVAGRWRTLPDLAQFQERAHAILREDFSDQPLWGWKDTRNCLTLPFWQSIIPNLIHIVCIRNPNDVATSMRKLGWLPSVDRPLNLWVEYTATALRHTSGAPRLILFYEDLMADWRHAFERIAAFLGRPDAAHDAEALREASAFVSSDLRHYQTDLVALFDDDTIPYAAKALFTQLMAASSRDLSTPELERFAQLSWEELRTTRAGERRVVELDAELRQQAARADARHDELAATKRTFDQQLQTLHEALAAAQVRATAAQQRADAHRAEEERLQALLARERHTIDSLHHELRWVSAYGEGWKALARARAALLGRLGEPDSLAELSRVIDADPGDA